MNLEPHKWNPFKFLRGRPGESDADRFASSRAGAREQSKIPFSDAARVLLREPWRVLEELLHDPVDGRSALERWFGDFSSSRFQPRIDVVDEGPIIRVTAELPGIERGDVQVIVEENAIVLRGEKKQDTHKAENGCYRLERAYGRFERTIPMPDYSDPGRALAKFDNGVLTLTVPKAEPAEPASTPIDIA